MITGNYQYASAASGVISTNAYLVTYVDQDTFTISTVSTSSSIGSITLFRCPINHSGNVGSVSRVSGGTYLVNFSASLPSEYPSVGGTACGVGIPTLRIIQVRNTIYPVSSKKVCIECVSQTPSLTDVDYISVQVFA